jgi:hypothetical protein
MKAKGLVWAVAMSAEHEHFHAGNALQSRGGGCFQTANRVNGAYYDSDESV